MILRSNKLPATSPGKVLQKVLKQNNLSTTQSAKSLEISLGDLTKLLEGNMSVDTLLAKNLEGFTGISCGFWMNLQSTYDPNGPRVSYQISPRTEYIVQKQRSKD